jgi:hypothetical protein
VTLHDVFPNAGMMRAKFGPQAHRAWDREDGNTRLNRVRARYEEWMLKLGHTNFLEHDRLPLLQTFVEVHLCHDAGGWNLRLTPRRGEETSGNQTLPPIEWTPSPIHLWSSLPI